MSMPEHQKNPLADGLRPHPLIPEAYSAALPRFEYLITKAHYDDKKPFRELPSGLLRTLQLDLQVLLNQHNGTFNLTNAIAADMAPILARDARQEFARMMGTATHKMIERITAEGPLSEEAVEMITTVMELVSRFIGEELDKDV